MLAVLSATCPECLAGYELLLRMPPAATRLVLWTAMKDGDSVDTVVTLIADDKHCTHYWENEGWPVSTRLRPLFGLGPLDSEKSAWDVYLVSPGIIWTQQDLPMPSDWTHNLGDQDAERPRITEALMAGGAPGRPSSRLRVTYRCPEGIGSRWENRSVGDRVRHQSAVHGVSSPEILS